MLRIGEGIPELADLVWSRIRRLRVRG
jgi:hypothetical protein